MKTWGTFLDLLTYIRKGWWQFGWDDRKPLPGFAGAVYLWYDGPHWAVRVWRLYWTTDVLRGAPGTWPKRWAQEDSQK